MDNVSGKVSFAVDCSENGIYINTITVDADNGSPNNPDVSEDIFVLVRSQKELRDGDEVMFGVLDTSVPYIMGVYNEMDSQNNIWAVKATDHTVMNVKMGCIYRVQMHDGFLHMRQLWRLWSLGNI